MKSIYITLAVLITGVVIFYTLYYNYGHMLNGSNPKTAIPLSTDNAMLSKALQEKLLNTKEDSFGDDKVSARKMKTEFLPHSVIWLMFSYPGLKDMPLPPIGARDGKLFALSPLESTVKFYNDDLKISKQDDFTKLAIELLQVAYFTEEFGYANNTSKGRGYNIISNINEISGLTGQTIKFNVQPPKTTKQDDKYTIEVWFWGAHNCQLHKFTLTASESGIKDYKDGVMGKLGKCYPLSYE